MIRIDTRRVVYLSQLDEDSFFRWAKRLRCVTSIDVGYLHIRSKTLSDADLRDLIALLYRYKVPMHTLKQFGTPANKHWFKSKTKYWYRRVFGDA